MVSLAPGRLTKIGFRKDVRLFLGALVGYLVFMILALLMVLQRTVYVLDQSHEEHWQSVQQALVRDLESIGGGGGEEIKRILDARRADHHLVVIEVELADGTKVRSGFPGPVESRELTTTWKRGTLTIHVDDSLPRGETRRFRFVTAIAFASTVGMTILLVLYLPKIVGPIEALLDHAHSVEEKAAGVDEANFLVDTFRKTIETLRVQREELARLHEIEKTRADELVHVSAGIAHEFRNSLSTILGYLRLALRARSLAEAGERVARAENESLLLTQAVEKLLGFARPMSVELHDVALRPFLDDLVSRLRGEAEEVEWQVSGDDAVVRGDAALLRVAIENLLRNALDAVRRTPRAGRISIAVRHDARVSIRIDDNGFGIDPADASRLFLPFQSDRPGGFGLGLAIAKKIVLLHGGDIRLTGVPGEGATVSVELDAAESEPATERRA